MTLSEKIYKLRTEQNLSQGDLADRLEVSRQSVSKWETGTSVPDLDKLIKLSEVFHITLDELILDRTSADTPTASDISVGNSVDLDCPKGRQEVFSSTSAQRPNDFSPRKAFGISLFRMAFIVFFLGLITNNYPLMAFSVPFILCCMICLTCTRHAGLWCIWALFLSTDVLLRLSTGVSWHYLFVLLSSGGGLNLNVMFSIFLFLAAAALVIITALCLYRKEMNLGRLAPILLLGGWAVLILCAPLPILLHRYSPAVFSLPYLGGILIYEAEVMLAAILLTLTFRYLYNRKRQ